MLASRGYVVSLITWRRLRGPFCSCLGAVDDAQKPIHVACNKLLTKLLTPKKYKESKVHFDKIL